jgi:DMSO/TMAO reductase YedYZ molybdopterin-dependent catalytic subunit
MTSLIGVLLLGPLIIVAVSGFASHAAYEPALGQNAIVPPGHDLGFLRFAWPTRPVWLYAASQGLHVTIGIVATPLLLAKLWSVIPRLFAWPPLRSPLHALERLSLIGLVGGALFEFVTGVINVQVYYPWRFGFVQAHYYGAVIFTASLIAHVIVKLPVLRLARRTHGALAPLRDDLRSTRPEPPGSGGLAPAAPAAPTLSRRGLLAIVGGASGLLAVLTAGQSVGGPLRALALLAPRGGPVSGGANGFAVNKTAAAVGVRTADVGAGWRLALNGPRGTLALRREQLLALRLHTHELPIACVEGWSTTQHWTGVRLADLRALAGAGAESGVAVASLQRTGPFNQATLSPAQVSDPRSLLALRVNDAELSLDHGYPARVIVPALPGVHNTKWVTSLSFAPPRDVA